ncbi:leader peptidase (prepilin peptidase) / N-methyltransferase [Propionispira arboris]|uniref:Leader peptidase (Prepilin peptidase) / N-methyltransferase n=1 Tax=Propionispira arboris TaxID=84035 RepID=A0A1H7BQ59_9FIRM|nr:MULTISPECIES: A24 family peptidase [Propionispira]SEJ79843.1 leader peptidase (prepilin peptidase) / N-methyltransferase [Propionispira arboris]
MLEQFSYFSTFFMLFILTILLSKLCSELFQSQLASISAILEKPTLLFHSTAKREACLCLLFFAAYILTAPLAVDPFNLLILWIFVSFLIFISIMDLEQQIILDNVLYCFFFCGLFFSFFLPELFLNRLLAACSGGLLLLILAILTRGAIGGGDIKLLFVLGFWLGIDKLLFTLFFGFISGGFISILLLLSHLKKRHDTIAYGPYFALGAILSMFH